MESICTIVTEFEKEIIANMPLPPASSGKFSLGRPGVLTGNFTFALFQDSERAMRFLRTSRLIKSQMECERCKVQMKLEKTKRVSDGMRWYCPNFVQRETEPGKYSRVQCKASRSIRHNSWFSRSRLTLYEVLSVTIDILLKIPTGIIIDQRGISSRTHAEWLNFCRETMYKYITENGIPIGGRDEIVEVIECKIGKKKYDVGHYVEGQYVFGGMERETDRSFLVPVVNRSSETLSELIRNWILPGTTVISGSWEPCRHLGETECKNLEVNHSITFAARETGTHANTVDIIKHVKASVAKCDTQVDFVLYLAEYMFRKQCEANGVHVCNKFMEIVRMMDWCNEHDSCFLMDVNSREHDLDIMAPQNGDTVVMDIIKTDPEASPFPSQNEETSENDRKPPEMVRHYLEVDVGAIKAEPPDLSCDFTSEIKCEEN